jgi:hypothetical protein
MIKRMVSISSGIAVVAGVLMTPPVWAAAPSNDNRADATRLSPPEKVTGTLVDATLEPVNDSSSCATTDASVWYRFGAPKAGAIIVTLDAAGDMDATVDLYRQVRSKLVSVDCSETDSDGRATLDEESLTAGGDYVIRIGRQVGSTADAFSLNVLVPSPPPQPPGKPLPAKGTRGTVDRLLNSGDAFWTAMRAGVTQRLSLRVNQCTSLEVYAPGVRDFEGMPLKTMRCGGYSLFTPDRTGRYVLLVRAGKGRATQRYRLQVAPARRIDTAPGVFIANNASVRGRVNGGINSRHLYRFDVSRRSELRLWVTGGDTELRLVRDGSRRYGRDSSFDFTAPAGRYYVAVEGSGQYTLHRVSRTLTKSSVRFNGRKQATVSPGSSVRVGLQVTNGVAGPGVMLLERLDPIDGWQFVRKYRVSVSGGSATVSFTPQVGRYRVFGEFLGTRNAAPSDGGRASLRVQGPLVQ